MTTFSAVDKKWQEKFAGKWQLWSGYFVGKVKTKSTLTVEAKKSKYTNAYRT
jgi:hypothetical protein